MRVSHYWLAVTACGNCLQWRQDMNYLLCSGAVSGGQEASVRSHLGLKLIRGWFCRSYFQNWIILLLCVTLYWTISRSWLESCRWRPGWQDNTGNMDDIVWPQTVHWLYTTNILSSKSKQCRKSYHGGLNQSHEMKEFWEFYVASDWVVCWLGFKII